MSELWRSPLPIVLALAVVWLVSWLPRRGVSGRGWALFRCLLPSWRFFEQFEPVPALHYRSATADGWGEWQEALPVPARTARSLILNGAGNLHLACRSLVEHLVAELEDAEQAGRPHTQLISYQLVRALVEERLRAPHGSMPRYQFRLAGPARDSAPLFVSSIHGST